jgi:Holliday junction resolvase RusA-like endonuclease
VLRFWFTRPKSHPKRTPTWPVGKKQDLDKLERAAYDSLSSVVFEDDGQILRNRSEKDYGPEPGVEVIVHELGPG